MASIDRARQTQKRGDTVIEWDFSKNTSPVRFTKAEEKTLVIERRWQGKREVITFSQAYTELSGWLGRSFSNCSEWGFSDSLFEMFIKGSVIHTPKAEYRLWNARKIAGEAVAKRRAA